jgi:DNA modification methylase
MNTLYLGDCLNVLRDSVADESVDLIYIDPPFNSKRDYNMASACALMDNHFLNIFYI